MSPELLHELLDPLLDGDGQHPVLLDGDGGLAVFWLRDQMPDVDEERLAARWHAALTPRVLILA